MNTEIMSAEKQEFFEMRERSGNALAYGDLIGRNGRMAEVGSDEIDISGQLSRNIWLRTPMIASPMQTVTGAKMIIAMDKLGATGVLPASLPIERLVKEAETVKKYLNGIIETPDTVRPDQTVEEVLNRCEKEELDYRSFPVVDENNRLLGMFTQADFDFAQSSQETMAEGMSPFDPERTAPVGIDAKRAYELMRSMGKISALPLIDDERRLSGMYIKSDVLRTVHDNPENFSIDERGQLLLGVAIPTDPDQAQRRIEATAGMANFYMFDSAHGNSKYILPALRDAKESTPVDVIAGNTSHGVPTRKLIDEGADGIRNGNGGGASCSTTPNTGQGTTPVTANYRTCKEANGDVPVIADGGISEYGHFPIAYGTGGDTAMCGSFWAGTEEAPGKIRWINGVPHKDFFGEGSTDAYESNPDAQLRYGRKGIKPAPEGESMPKPVRGSVVTLVQRAVHYTKTALEYAGVKNLDEHRRYTMYDQISNEGRRTMYPHETH